MYGLNPTLEMLRIMGQYRLRNRHEWSDDEKQEFAERSGRADGPVVPGSLFPFLFVTIACGELSGFHALISSGTTPKLVEKENS